MSGTLYLIPVPLGDMPPQQVLPQPVIEQARQLTHFVVERAKSARAFLKAIAPLQPLQQLQLAELNEHTPQAALAVLLAPLLAGQDMGLLSEAGCPAIADPGAELVALAQDQGIRVVPLVGPSSILMALMASGLCGQRFAFHGYLTAKENERPQALRQLENESRQHRQTQIFIETPYRNRQMFDALLRYGQPRTRLTVATNISLPGESIRTCSIAAWKKAAPPDLERRPTVFLLLG